MITVVVLLIGLIILLIVIETKSFAVFDLLIHIELSTIDDDVMTKTSILNIIVIIIIIIIIITMWHHSKSDIQHDLLKSRMNNIINNAFKHKNGATRYTHIKVGRNIAISPVIL